MCARESQVVLGHSGFGFQFSIIFYCSRTFRMLLQRNEMHSQHATFKLFNDSFRMQTTIDKRVHGINNDGDLCIEYWTLSIRHCCCDDHIQYSSSFIGNWLCAMCTSEPIAFVIAYWLLILWFSNNCYCLKSSRWNSIDKMKFEMMKMHQQIPLRNSNVNVNNVRQK